MGNILDLCKEPANVTRIVYQCNLNFNTVRQHLECLIDAGLVEVSGIGRISYQTTQKGMQALEHIDAFRPMLISVSHPQDQNFSP